MIDVFFRVRQAVGGIVSYVGAGRTFAETPISRLGLWGISQLTTSFAFRCCGGAPQFCVLFLGAGRGNKM